MVSSCAADLYSVVPTKSPSAWDFVSKQLTGSVSLSVGSDVPQRTRSAVWSFGMSSKDQREKTMEKVRESLLKPEYNVTNFYHKQGVFQEIARSHSFEKLTLLVIAVNALWMWIDTDYNTAVVFTQAAPEFQLVEHSFCIYFSLEWTIRFMAFRWKRDCFRDAWFCFDSVLVIMMVMESWCMTAVVLIKGNINHNGGGDMSSPTILRMARLLRLSRMVRIVRLFRAQPEIVCILKGMMKATRPVLVTLTLLIILVYVFAIALRQLTDGTAVGKKHFGSVPSAMHTLIIDGTFLSNLGLIARSLAREHPALCAIFWAFVLLTTCTVMNMLIGVLCEVVNSVAAIERETIRISFVTERMHVLFKEIDQSGDGKISKCEFLGIMEKPYAVKLLEEVGVDVEFLVDQSDVIFHEYQQNGHSFAKAEDLTFEKLMKIILDLRGTNYATVKDLVDVRRHMLSSMRQTNRTLMVIEDLLRGRDRLDDANGHASAQPQAFREGRSARRAEVAFRAPQPLAQSQGPEEALNGSHGKDVRRKSYTKLRCCCI